MDWNRFVHRLAVAALLPALTLVACENATHGANADSGPLVAQLARISASRSTAARLSIATKLARCQDASSRAGASGANTPCSDSASSSEDPRIVALAGDVAAALRREPNADALHASALIDLLWPNDAAGGKSADRSISSLRRAASLGGPAALPPVLTDLAAALMARARRSTEGGGGVGSARDLLEAIDVADRALAIDPRNPQAQFNHALALERLGADERAMRAWTSYLATDSASAWADEARKRRDGLPHPSSSGDPGGGSVTPAGSPAAADTVVSPQAARERGWNTLLVGWGRAMLAGDELRADTLLERASVLGDALERRGGDASLAEATRALRALPRASMRARRIARAHVAYGDGIAAMHDGRYKRAQVSFAQAATGAAHASRLRAWAEVEGIGAQLTDGPNEAVVAGLAAIARIDARRYPALAARAHWVTATSLIRSGRPEDALHQSDSAAALFERAGERENVGSMMVNGADARYTAGDISAMHDEMHRALLMLRAYRGGVFLHNLLYIWAEATSDEMPLVAGELQDEGIEAAKATRQDAVIAEARLERAKLAVAAGDTARARSEVIAARPLLDSIPAGRRREWIEADLALAEAGLSARSAPDDALRSLDRAVARFTSLGNAARLLPALVARAEARLAAHRDAEGEADLERAVGMIETRHDLLGSIRLRATLLQAARRTLDRIVMRRLASGRVADALAYMDRARASLEPLRRAPVRRTTRIVAPPGESALELAFVGDTLLAWTVVGDSVHLDASRVDHGKFLQVVQRVRSTLEMGLGEERARADLETLYDWLIRPSALRLGADDTPVTIAADGEIEAVPFAALVDASDKRYLIERHPLRFVPRLGDRGPGDRSEASARTALLVSDPAFAMNTAPGLGRLPGSRAEVADISREYASPRVLDGAQATRAAFLRGLQGADVVHFAGHAVFDDDRPERSHLVLAADSGARSELSAADVTSLDLRGIRLVVLSACETARPESSRSGGYTGLTGGFLVAGARAVVGTLWRVDDVSAKALMVDFHREYRTRGNVAAALRAAQIAALRSTDQVRSSPAAWAAFRYDGL